VGVEELTTHGLASPADVHRVGRDGDREARHPRDRPHLTDVPPADLVDVLLEHRARPTEDRDPLDVGSRGPGLLGLRRRLADHINDQTVNDEANIPFGGVGASGTGSRFGGAAADIEAFPETQWVTMRSEPPVYPFRARPRSGPRNVRGRAGHGGPR
jgi:hypothetical protein